MLYFRFICVFLVGFAGFAQSPSLAKNYVNQGEYEKAASIYKQLYQKNSENPFYLFEWVHTLQAQEKYQEAEKLLSEKTKGNSINPKIIIELGRNEELQGRDDNAKKKYQQALTYLKKSPNFAYLLGATFQQYGLLDEAEQAYKIALEHKPNPTYTVQLAQIYGENGELTKMFSTYIELLEEEPNYFFAVNRNFSEFITEDPQNEANQALRKILLKRSQKEPNIIYNELLSWLFTQQQQYGMAFNQQKAIYQRSENPNFSQLKDLAQVAIEKKASETGREILQYIIEKTSIETEKIKAYEQLMKITISETNPKNYKRVDEKFAQIFDTFGKGTATYGLQLQYARFLAFQQGEKQTALDNLQQLKKTSLSREQEAQLKLVVADILIAQEKFNQALIYYSQVQQLVKNSPLAQQATFKIAQTSYYKGDFDWAQTQLKVLKNSTSQLIANDAMELSLLISDNILEDSTHTALKLLARADLLQFQQKNEEALNQLDSILMNHKGEAIEDEALFKKAKIEEKRGNYETAASSYQKIIQFYGNDILADDAHYFLAELYRTKLNQPEKAKEQYKALIFNFADSIYFVDARKKFRTLRGDAVE